MGNGALIRVARKNGRTIAAILTLTYKHSVMYKYGCSDARFQNLGGMQFLFWAMIQDANQRGFSEIDFGYLSVATPG